MAIEKGSPRGIVSEAAYTAKCPSIPPDSGNPKKYRKRKKTRTISSMNHNRITAHFAKAPSLVDTPLAEGKAVAHVDTPSPEGWSRVLKRLYEERIIDSVV